MSNMVVRTNIFSLNAHRNMKNTGLEMGRTSNRLASGFRINSAADDAAGLAISENMRAQIRGLDQASRNAQDGQAMLLTTEGGLEEIGNILQRVRELLVQASNDTNTQLQRNMIEQEIAQLGEEILSMQTRVEFNTNQVLNVGFHGAIRVTMSEARATFAEAQAEIAGAVADFATATMDAREAHGDAISEARATFVGLQSDASDALAAAMAEAGTQPADLQSYARAAALAVFDAAIAQATAELNAEIAAEDAALAAILMAEDAALRAEMEAFTAQSHIFISMLHSQFFLISEDTLNQVGTAWYQVGANSLQGIQFDFTTVSQAVLVAGNLVTGIADALVTAGTLRDTGIGFGIDISPLINAVGDGLDAIGRVRANLGAVQNRMDYTMRSLDISSENLQDSESRVRNADIAREMMRFTMTNVLQQAAVSMLAQANQIPQNLLQLLR